MKIKNNIQNVSFIFSDNYDETKQFKIVRINQFHLQ